MFDDGSPAAGKGGGPQPFSNAFKGASINSLRYNTSQKGSPLAVCYGTQRISINLIGGFGFQGGAGGGKKGGKGGGGKGAKKGGQPSYSVNAAFALCQGPVGLGGSNKVWANSGVSAASLLPLNYYTGTDGQAPDPVFQSSSGDPPILGYSGTAYVTGTPLQLGAAPVLPNMQFEVTGFGAGTGGPSFPADARPDWIVVDMLTNPRYGAGFPIGNLDTAGAWGAGGSVSDWGTWCQAAALAMSYVMDRQQPAARWLEEIAEQTVSAVFWSGAMLKIVPYADAAASGNGASWSPVLTYQYDLHDPDFLDFGGGGDPIAVTRADPAQVPNWISAEFENTAYNYNKEVIPVWDQGAIDRYGLNVEASYMTVGFTNPTSATIAAQLRLQRKQYIRNTYRFKLGWRFSLLEPMDVVLLSDATLGLAGAVGLTGVPVRITQIDEDDNGELTVTAEDIAAGSATLYTRQATAQGPLYDPYVAPGNANPPVIFEPPPALSGGVAEVWVVSSGGANWGGCQVWISTDDTTYAMAGTIYAGARQGLLTAILASGADPDTVNTLKADLTQSLGTLLSGTQADADNFVTLCYVDGELISYRTATLTAANQYDLTYLRRGVYGTPIGAHAGGTKFCRFGPNTPSVFQYAFPENFVGETIYLKLPSFNKFGQAAQTLDSVAAYTYSLTGAGAATPAFEVPGSQSGITTANLVVGRFAFCSTAVFDNAFIGSRAVAATAAAAETTYLIKKNGATIGTMVFGAGATTATFTSTASSTPFNPGDVLTIVAPASPDATLAGLAWTLLGRQGGVTPVAEAHGSQSGLTTANLVIGRWIADNPVTFPSGLAGSIGRAGIAATGSTTYTLKKNGVGFGTMVFGAGATSASFTAASATILNPGDVLTVEAPASPDATLANLAWALAATDNLGAPNAFIDGSMSGAPIPAGLVIERYVFAASMVMPSGLTGSVAAAGTAGAGSTAFDIKKNGVSAGTMTFAGGATAATFAMAAPATWNPGDVLTIVAPGSPDPSLANLAWALAGTR